MALVQSAVTVTTSPTLIAEIPPKNPLTAVIVYNGDNSNIWIGGPNVAATGANTGLHIAKAVAQQVWLNAEDKLYAISVAGTSSNAVSVIFSKVI